MSEIFVLIARGGQYDERWEENLAASFSREKLVALMAQKQASIDKVKMLCEAITQFQDKWDLQNPEPELGHRPPDKSWPSFVGLKQVQITAEMRAERQRIKDENSRALHQWYQPQRDHDARRQEETLEFRATLDPTLLNGAEDGLSVEVDAKFYIETIPFVED